MLTKRTYIVPVLIACIAFPAAALAEGGAASPSPTGIAKTKPVHIAALQRPVVRFHKTIRLTVAQMEEVRRIEARRRQRRLYATLPGGVSRSTLDAIGVCESGGDPTAISSGGTYRGKYQFDYGTWESVGGAGDPATASEQEQDYRAALLYSRSGLQPVASLRLIGG